MGQEFNNWIVAIVRPPLLLLNFVLKKSYSLLFAWWLDKKLVNRSNRHFEDDIRRQLSFLFDDFHARVVLNEKEPPPSFDFALITLSAKDLMFQIFRDRGAITMRVSSPRIPNDWHEVSSVLNVMDVGVERQTFSNLHDLERIVQPHMKELRAAFSEACYPEVKLRLSDVYAYDRAVTRQWETEINRRLYPRE
jgi:hypothetical protein